MAAKSAGGKHLEALPEELLQHIVEHLDSRGLTVFSLAAKWCYELASSVRWREVVLTDCLRVHGERDAAGNRIERTDDHDDTPLLKKLVILATRPSVARHVQTVIHRCHLPQPAIFNELPKATFSGMTLSPDPRTTRLVQLAVQRMTRVHTLRIIFGHPNINDALLRCFFAKGRCGTTPVRRLWLEDCRVSAGCDLVLLHHPLDLPLELDFTGVESIRFRRMPLRPGQLTTHESPFDSFVYARGRQYKGIMELQDGAGGHYITAGYSMHHEMRSVYRIEDEVLSGRRYYQSVYDQFREAYNFDSRIYWELVRTVVMPRELESVSVESIEDYVAFGYRGQWIDPVDFDGEKDRPLTLWKAQRERKPSADVALALLHSASATLTSVCLDWVLTPPPNNHRRSALKWAGPSDQGWALWIKTYVTFFELRFPHLRALQFRNAVVIETMHPHGLYLFHQSDIPFGDDEEAEMVLGGNYKERVHLVCLKFMEYHTNLQCLAWPMDGFFSDQPPTSEISDRIQAVIDNLGRTLLDLRVDMLYIGQGERQTDDFPSSTRERRQRFISNFAARMTKVESIKVEGGIPRDERREVIRALHACPLQKIVMIGVCSAVGNTWGQGGREIAERISSVEVDSLEGEDKDAIFKTGFLKPVPPDSDFKFIPCYGKPMTSPMLHTIAAFHPETVRELKFCGYKGSPVLFSPAPICQPLLHPLKHFNNLDSLILSVWLSTIFEDAPRDSDIISYWLDARSPNSTSLVRIVQDEEPEGWERELKTKFAPDALAWQITSFIGPFLSEKAKSRKRGVHVRASMCVGDWGGIFDIDLRIGKGSLNSDICLEFEGPREELEPGRRRSKLENRRWF